MTLGHFEQTTILWIAKKLLLDSYLPIRAFNRRHSERIFVQNIDHQRWYTACISSVTSSAPRINDSLFATNNPIYKSADDRSSISPFSTVSVLSIQESNRSRLQLV